MSAKTAKIAVVEDDQVVRHTAVQLLELSTSQQVLAFEDGASAWTHLSSDPAADVVITDMQMPQMNGLELLSRLKEQDPARICIVMSGDPTNEPDARRLGADAFLRKPFKIADLVTVMRALGVNTGA
jgi:CheY-like chemotaxis protein